MVGWQLAFTSFLLLSSFLFLPLNVNAAVIYQQSDHSVGVGSGNSLGRSWILPSGLSGSLVQARAWIDTDPQVQAAMQVTCFTSAAATTVCPEQSSLYTSATTTLPRVAFGGEAVFDFASAGLTLSSSRFYRFRVNLGSLSSFYVAGTSTPDQCTVGACSGIDGAPYLTLTDFSNVASNVAATTTWKTGQVYKVSGNIIVNTGVTLTIEPGTIVKFDTATSSSLIVNGTLNATSTGASITYFTSWKDDSVGGDSNGDGSGTAPAAGDWGNIKIGSGGIANIAYATIRYGGAGSQGLVRNNGGNLLISNSAVATSSSYGILSDSSGATTTIQASDITNTTHGFYSSDGVSLIHASSTIHNNTHGVYLVGGDTRVAYDRVFDNANFGVYVDNATARVDVSDIYDNADGVHVADGTASAIKITSSHIHDNSYGIYITDGLASIASNVIENNSNQGVFNTGSGGTVPATYNYWGAADGPGGAGPGSGDEVTVDVDYDPFLTQAHYVQTDNSGNLLSSVGGGNEIDWNGGPFYPEAWYPALETWGALGSIAFATDTPLTIQDLEIASTTADDLAWAGLWDPNPSPDTLTVNAYYMDTYSLDEKRNVFTHELGHALGLGHSYLGNMMHYTITGTTTLGTQDISDYNYLWP